MEDELIKEIQSINPLNVSPEVRSVLQDIVFRLSAIEERTEGVESLWIRGKRI